VSGRALSILVPSVHTRYATFARDIQEALFSQYDHLTRAEQDAVEILVLTDTKSINLGVKRNMMLDMAQGKYVAFVDDDDRIAHSYLLALLEATQHDADVITFDVLVSLDGAKPKPCYYSPRFRKDYNYLGYYHRLPNHLMAVKREHAVKARFPELGRGEDSEYARRLKPFLETEHNIPHFLYHYDFNSRTTETQR